MIVNSWDDYDAAVDLCKALLAAQSNFHEHKIRPISQSADGHKTNTFGFKQEKRKHTSANPDSIDSKMSEHQLCLIGERNLCVKNSMKSSKTSRHDGGQAENDHIRHEEHVI